MGSIWLFAALYFAAYVPYSALTKSLSKGIYPGMEAEIAGASLLPVATMVAIIVAFTFITLVKWWKFATHRKVFGFNIPTPTLWTGLSGLCTSVILTTTTLAYTFDGVSIVFMMLLMRGGVLIIAPIVDAMTGRSTRWFSWVGLGLSMAALIVAFADRSSYELTVVAVIDLTFYLLAYLIRLRFMSRLAKTDDPATTKRYFVEEQMVTTPATLLILGLFALIGEGTFMEQIRAGFTTHFESGLVFETALIGFFSQCTGIFGTLVFLDRRENTFSVPVNRSSSILAGVVASTVLAVWLDQTYPSVNALIGAGLVVVAVVVLSLGPSLSRSKEA